MNDQSCIKQSLDDLREYKNHIEQAICALERALELFPDARRPQTSRELKPARAQSKAKRIASTISVPRDSSPPPDGNGRGDMASMVRAVLPDLMDEFTVGKICEVVQQRYRMEGEVRGKVAYALKQLIAAGVLTAEGTTSNRVYRKAKS